MACKLQSLSTVTIWNSANSKLLKTFKICHISCQQCVIQNLSYMEEWNSLVFTYYTVWNLQSPFTIIIWNRANNILLEYFPFLFNRLVFLLWHQTNIANKSYEILLSYIAPVPIHYNTIIITEKSFSLNTRKNFYSFDLRIHRI